MRGVCFGAGESQAELAPTREKEKGAALFFALVGGSSAPDSSILAVVLASVVLAHAGTQQGGVALDSRIRENDGGEMGMTEGEKTLGLHRVN
jgi:hypothetical protein